MTLSSRASSSCLYVCSLERNAGKVYSYFEKGCLKKCTWQTRKALWVVLISLFFKESQDIMAREATDICLWVLKESNKSRFDSYQVRNSVLIISHTTFRDFGISGFRVHIIFDYLSRNICIQSLSVNKGVFAMSGNLARKRKLSDSNCATLEIHL